jgi:hypothetical protein
MENIRQEAEAEGYLVTRYPKSTKSPIEFWQIYFTPAKLKAELSKHDVIPKEWLDRIVERYQQQKDATPHLDIFLMAEDGAHIKYESWGHPAKWPRMSIFNPQLGEVLMLDKKFPAPHDALSFLQLYYNTPDIITNAHFSTQYNRDYSEGVSLKNLKDYPQLLEYFENYFRFVFGNRFSLGFHEF